MGSNRGMSFLSILGTVLTACIALSVGSSIPTERIGDIVINDQLSPLAQFSWDVDVPKVRDTQVYDMLARLFGAPRVVSSNELKLNIDLFDRPAGLLTFTIEGVSSHQLSAGSLQTLGRSQTHDITPSSEPHTTSSVLASVLTGLNPDQHGITNNRWPTNSRPPYTSGNFFDAVADLRSGKIISGSSSIESANIISPSIIHSSASTFHWVSSKKTFVGIAPGFSLSIQDFPSLFQQLSTLTGRRIVYTHQDSHVSIFTQDDQPVVFDLTDEDDEALLAEILFVLNAANQDLDFSFFSFHFSSPQDILLKYSSSSPEYQTAIFLIDAVISNLVKSYPTYASFIIYFPSSYAHPEVHNTILPYVAQDLETPKGVLPLTAFKNFLPHIFLSSTVDSSRSKSLCNLVRQSVSALTHPIDIICDDGLSNKRASFQDDAPEPEPEPSPSPSPTPSPPSPVDPPADQATVALVHIILWMSVFLVAGVIFSSYQLFLLDGSGEPEFKSRSLDFTARTQKVQ